MRDVYADLMNETRGMRRDQARARDVWYADNPLEQKEARLFELEMLLKGLACFANPRNHPGATRSSGRAAHDFRHELTIVRETLERVGECLRDLLGDRDGAYVFSRYLETVMPEDVRRNELLQQQLTQHTPEESLLAFRTSFSGIVEISRGLAELPRVSHQVHSAMLGTVTREIGRNEYFNPLVPLEFRLEFDRIRHPGVLSVLDAASGAAHRVLALTFLSFFRLLRYLRLIDQYAEDRTNERLSFVVLSVFRSDVRAVTQVLGENVGDALADSFGDRLLSTPAEALSAQAPQLWAEVRDLKILRSTLASVSRTLQVEADLVCGRELMAPHQASRDGSLGPSLVIGTAALRFTLHHAIRTVCLAVDDAVELGELGSTQRSALNSSIRLRREVWTFQQVLRAFLAKAGNAGSADRWNAAGSFSFVREFLGHFRAIGYQLARFSDYPRLDRIVQGVSGLRDVDLLDPTRADEILEECQTFRAYLQDLFSQIDGRSELKDHPFDRKEAAAHLRRYLGAV